jgi:hypothetical protein
MSYINFSVADKGHRATHIVTDLGATAYAIVYSGAMPVSPDVLVPSGNLLVALPCSSTPGVVAFAVQTASVNAVGSGGTTGTQTVTGTTGTGTPFQAQVVVAGGVIASVLAITVAGSYSVVPTSLSAEPVTGGGLTGAKLSLGMTAVLTMNAITTENAAATGTASFVRLAAANTAGAAGVVDLDAGTAGTSVTLNTTSLVSGAPVVITAAVITEA